MTKAANNKVENNVRKRKVFYVPGFDPISPRRYRELYRKEGAQQAAISGYDITVKGAASTTENYGWNVSCTTEGIESSAHVEVLAWSDIVKSSIQVSIFSTYVLLIRTVWIYLSTGAIFRLARLRRGPILAALYPVFILLMQFSAATVSAFMVFLLLGTFATPFVAFFCALILFCAVLYQFKKVDSKIFAYYLMQDYGFSARFYGANPPALEQRITQFRDRVREAVNDDYDEVLLVGHSSGAHIAISILADVLRLDDLGKAESKLSLLSLGQVVPMVSFLPQADRLRRDLHFLCQQSKITWVDMTAPTDNCNFALCDPVCVSGVAPEGAKKRWPLVISGRFSETIESERLNELRNRFFQLHIQYLCHFDYPDLYDYFQITAGSKSLSERYAREIPSASRIETALSAYTNMAP